MVISLLQEINVIRNKLVKKGGYQMKENRWIPEKITRQEVQNIIQPKLEGLRTKLKGYMQLIKNKYSDLNPDKFIFTDLGEGLHGQNFYNTYFKDADYRGALTSLASLQTQVMIYNYKIFQKLLNDI